jgi:hypothetical protein
VLQVLVVALWIGLSAVAAASAHAKGHNALGFFLVSLIASPFLTLPALLMAQAQAHPSQLRGQTLGCHYCGQPRPAEAPVCPTCQAGPWAAMADAVTQCGACCGRVLRSATKCLHCGTILQEQRVLSFPPLAARRVPRQEHLAPALEK